MKKIISLLLTLLLLISITACKKDESINVSFTEDEITLTVGETKSIVPNVKLGEDADSNYVVEYSLSNDKATVDNKGNVTAITAGSTILTAKVGDASAKITIIIKDKTSYQIILDVNGGDALSNVMINFTESSQVVLPTPERSGYTFLGWYEGEIKVETLTNKNYVLVAKWEKQIETYTISYDAQGATLPSDVVTSFEENQEVTLPELTKEGYNFLGWYEGEQKVEEIENKNYSLVAKFEAIKYTISYTNDGSQVTNPVEYTIESETIVLTNPEKAGYTFLGWYEGEQKIEQIEKGSTKNYSLVAKWEKIVPTYTISYDAQGATLPSDAVKSFKENEAVTLPVVSKEGYTFLGWYEGEEKIESITNKNYTLVAKWEAQTKNINYVLNGGALADNAPKTFVVGEGVKLVNPTKAGSFFKGWFDNQACTGTAITEISASTTKDVTLYACWEVNENTEGITYILNGGNTKYQTREALVNDLLADMSTAAGFTITASTVKAAQGFRQTEINAFLANSQLYNKWVWLFKYFKSINTHTPALNVYEELLTSKTVNSTYDGSALWYYVTRDLHNFINKSADAFFYGAGLVDFRVYQNADGFWHLIEEKHESTTATSLVTPIRPYYTFEGWYDNEACEGTAVTTPVAGSVLYAKWSKQTSKLTYVLNNADATLTNTVVNIHASESIELETPVYDEEAYIFNGWYSDSACTNKITNIAEYTLSDVTVYASWSVLDGYTLTYVLNDGNWRYESYEEIVTDFLKDFNSVTGKNVGADGLYGAADVYGTFYANSEMFNKWIWIVKFFYALSGEKIGYHSESHAQYEKFLSGKGTSVTTQWALRQNMQGFMTRSRCAKYSGAAAIDFSDDSIFERFWDYLKADQQVVYQNNKGTVTLLTPVRQFYTFGGWYKSSDFSGSAVTTVSSKSTVYAKWVEETPVESLTIDNKITELRNYGKHQLEWTIAPSNAAVQSVTFKSSDTSVATVDKNGLITAVGVGTVTITVTSNSHSKKSDSVSFNVYEPDFFDVSYETNSYVEIGGQIKLNATYTAKDGSNGQLTWSSLNTNIATVDTSGVVTGVSAGVATIRATVNGSSSTYFDFPVTVLSANASSLIKHIANANEANIFTRFNLGIGAGTPVYYADIYGSINKILFNDKLNIDNTYLATGNAAGNNSGTMSSVVFITVHYTGNMGVGADAEANAKYFVKSTGSSIHYTTGNDGVYHCMDDNKKAWHAGTGNSFSWTKTAVQAKSTDPKWPVWGINSSSYFTINGQSTGIKVPYESTRGYGYVKDSKWLNDMGLAWEIRSDGYYYMGNTHWHYKQVYEGRICSAGGNNNSIGIESCVDKGSDLWYTWQKTAQLVAQLMVNNSLSINRVVGHHFFTAKDCPQPLLENDKEIWWEFIELVEAEHALLTTYKGATISMTLNDNYSFVNNKGRVTEQPEFSQIVKYTVNVTFNGVSESITLASAVNGIYTN